jgi:ABC-type multidrug transport system ATPase subunit
MVFKFYNFHSIWDYLVEITNKNNTTVIITTHYIDETRQAHMIGLMRGGRFLAEETPDNLLLQYNADSLEDVFLKLAVIQNMGKRRRSSIAAEVIEHVQLPAISVRAHQQSLLKAISNNRIYFFISRIPPWISPTR